MSRYFLLIYVFFKIFNDMANQNVNITAVPLFNVLNFSSDPFLMSSFQMIGISKTNLSDSES